MFSSWPLFIRGILNCNEINYCKEKNANKMTNAYEVSIMIV